MSSTDVAFFICGAQRSRGGFEVGELGPKKLPGDPKKYLDRKPKARDRVTHEIRVIPIGPSQYVRYSLSWAINPSDSKTNRDQYFSLGFISGRKLPLHATLNCIAKAEELFDRVRNMLGPGNAFSQDFRFKHLADDLREGELQNLDHQCSALLRADLFLQAANATGRFADGERLASVSAEDLPEGADIGDYLLYSQGGTLGAGQSLDADRTRVARLARTVQRAADGVRSERDRLGKIQQALARGLESIDNEQERTALDDALAAVEAVVRRDPTSEGRSAPRLDVKTSAKPTARSEPRGAMGELRGGLVLPEERARKRNRPASQSQQLGEDSGFVALIVTGLLVLALVALFLFTRGPFDLLRPDQTGTRHQSPPTGTEAAPSASQLANERKLLDQEPQADHLDPLLTDQKAVD